MQWLKILIPKEAGLLCQRAIRTRAAMPSDPHDECAFTVPRPFTDVIYMQSSRENSIHVYIIRLELS